MSINTFSPGLHKLIHNHEHLIKLDNREITSPLHISVWPTITCQFNCPYCCFRKMREDNTELSWQEFICATDTLCKYGLKAMEFAGGGEPLLWPLFNSAIDYVFAKGIKISLVTNGLLLVSTPKETLRKINWVRVSLQNIQHAENINFRAISEHTKCSASLIVYNDNILNSLEEFYTLAKENNIFIRAAPQKPCTSEWETTVENEVKKFGHPLLFFRKERGAPKGCYMAWLRAAIDWRGYFLPCPSIELAEEFEAYIPDSFVLCHVSELEQWLKDNPPHDLGYHCSYCNCGKEMNDYIYTLFQDVEDIEFV